MHQKKSVHLGDGTLRFAELHWFEVHGIVKKEIRIRKVFGLSHDQ